MIDEPDRVRWVMIAPNIAAFGRISLTAGRRPSGRWGTSRPHPWAASAEGAIGFSRRLALDRAHREFSGMIEGSARSRVRAQSTGHRGNAGLHRSLIERSRGSRVAAYG